MAIPEDIYTARYYVDYEGLSGKHTMMFRFAPEVTDTEARTRITAVLTQLKTTVPASTVFNGLRRAAAGSAFSFPITWTNIVGTNATVPTANQYPQFISYVGRDVAGTRVRVTVHGVSGGPDTDYRYLENEQASVAAALVALRATGPSILTKGGLVPFWNSYANTGYNAYFQRKRRKVA